MKTRLFSVCILVVGLALTLTRAVTAQQPPESGGAPSGEGLGVKTTSAITLGQSGLSFRYVRTFGVTEEPYPTDAQHVNTPYGLFIDDSGNLYVVEERGYRMLKFDAAGANQLIVGHAGLPWHHDDYLSSPKDVAVKSSDGHIWVVMDHCIKEFDTDGTPVQRFPDADPWNTGADNEHLNGPRGIAFDTVGRLYVSDTENHRVQVYTFTVEGSLVYSTTIGETGVAGSDNIHFNRPTQIAFDSSDRLYVADTGNFRVQRCTYAAGWTCTTFHGGSEGSGDDELSSWACGIGTDDNDNVYIADTGNHRVKKCNSAGTCSTFANGFTGASGVAADSSGNVYVSDWDDGTIRKYSSSGGALGAFAGVSGVPYVADNVRLNTPWGIAVASDGSIYVTENRGLRLVKLNAAGIQQWTFGQAGVYGDDNTHLGSWWAGSEGNVAIDAAGRVYVPDTGNNRIQIFSSNGAYSTTFGSTGNGDYEFECPTGVAISPVNGDIYVTDHCNHRIQVFSSSRVYKATLGVLDETGTDNQHFNLPWGVGLDTSGNIYVADSENRRVQRCNLSGTSYTCTTFAGETGVSGDDFSHFGDLPAIAVDNAGRVYVADPWSNRIQVFDSSGAYLTTIAGAWGTNTSQMQTPVGIALDSAGNVYVTDRDNHRIQKFAPGVPGWRQVNINGFGDRNNWAVSRMSVFGNYLYAGTANAMTGGEMWRTANGTDWSQDSVGGFGVISNTAALVGEAWNGYLYVGTGNSDAGAEIWRCATCDGTDWTRVVSGGLGESNNATVQQIVVFSNTLYATTDNDATGSEVWKSSTGNPGSWTQCNVDGFGDNRNTGLWAAEVFHGYLYVATAQWGAYGTGTHTGTEVWRTNDGITWNQVDTDGFGDRDNMSPWLESFNGYLYALSYNSNTGAQIWRCGTCAGTDWVRVVSNGFGDSNNVGGGFMLGLGNYFYVGASNSATGTEIWRTANGTTWSQMNVDGFGDSNNVEVYSGAIFKDRLVLGTRNDVGWMQSANGGEVWQFVGYPVYLPLVVRNR